MANHTHHPAFWPSYQAALTALLNAKPLLASHDTAGAQTACRNAYITAEECVSTLKMLDLEDDYG